MAQAGLLARIDPAGNLVGRSADAHHQCVAIGSHIDTVPDGGAYDGVAGVVAGLEVARLIQRSAVDLPFALEVIEFLSEEPSDFGVSCIGSRAMVGTLSKNDLARRDQGGTSLEEALGAVGGRPEALGAPLREPGSLRAYLELHIEQGPVLERAGLGLGIVTGIVGIRRFCAQLAGAAAHAGTTPMDIRRDALAGAAELILAVERLARDAGRKDGVVGTVGRLAVVPNASNVVAGETTATIELRAMSERALDEAQAELESRVRALAHQRELGLTFSEVSRTPPIELDFGLRTMLGRAAAAAGIQTIELGAGKATTPATSQRSDPRRWSSYRVGRGSRTLRKRVPIPRTSRWRRT